MGKKINIAINIILLFSTMLLLFLIGIGIITNYLDRPYSLIASAIFGNVIGITSAVSFIKVIER